LAKGTDGQLLTLASGIPSWAAAPVTGVPYSGATGGVNLGDYDLTLRGMSIGKGVGNGTTNIASTAIGVGALTNASNSGGANTAFGYQTLTSITSTNNNTAIGATALKVSTGSNNTAVGSSTLVKNTSGSDNVAIGSVALSNNLISSKNVAIGTAAGESMTGGLNTAIGAYSDMATNTFSNATAIGYVARAQASNTIQLGADGVTQVNSVTTTAIANVRTSGTLTLKDVTYPNTHNSTAGQVLTVNATGTASWASPAASEGSGGHYVGEVYGGGIVFYITPGGYHGLIASSTDIVSNPYAIFDRATSPSYKSTTNSENLYMDWVTPTFSQLNLLYSARATTGLNLGNFFYISTTNGDNDAFSYKGLNFSNNVAGVVNGNWTSNGPEIRGRAIRIF
jgi:hypothetical protein